MAQPGRTLVGLITQQAIRRGSYRTVKELVRRIEAYVAHHNRTAGPFTWTATADSILAKVSRVAAVLSHAGHGRVRVWRVGTSAPRGR